MKACTSSKLEVWGRKGEEKLHLGGNLLILRTWLSYLFLDNGGFLPLRQDCSWLLTSGGRKFID